MDFGHADSRRTGIDLAAVILRDSSPDKERAFYDTTESHALIQNPDGHRIIAGSLAEDIETSAIYLWERVLKAR